MSIQGRRGHWLAGKIVAWIERRLQMLQETLAGGAGAPGGVNGTHSGSEALQLSAGTAAAEAQAAQRALVQHVSALSAQAAAARPAAKLSAGAVGEYQGAAPVVAAAEA